MDELKKATLAYSRLLNTEYRITVGKNNKLRSYILRFDRDDYKHILGLHKIKDVISIYRSSSSALFYSVVNGDIKQKDIDASVYYPEIKNRIETVIDLEKYLDNFISIYDWDKRRSDFSQINANLMIPNDSINSPNDKVYAFFSPKNQELHISDFFTETATPHNPVSLFTDSHDYRIGQLRPPALLYKEKINLKTNEKTILLDRLSARIEKSNEIKPIEFTIDTGSVNQNDGTMALSQPKVISIPNPLKPLGSLLEKAKSAITNFADSFKTSPKPKQAQNRSKSTTKKAKGNSPPKPQKAHKNDFERSEKQVVKDVQTTEKKPSIKTKLQDNQEIIAKNENNAPKKERQAPKKR